MRTVVLALGIWIVVTIPLAVVVGAALRRGRRRLQRSGEVPQEQGVTSRPPNT